MDTNYKHLQQLHVNSSGVRRASYWGWLWRNRKSEWLGWHQAEEWLTPTCLQEATCGQAWHLLKTGVESLQITDADLYRPDPCEVQPQCWERRRVTESWELTVESHKQMKHTLCTPQRDTWQAGTHFADSDCMGMCTDWHTGYRQAHRSTDKHTQASSKGEGFRPKDPVYTKLTKSDVLPKTVCNWLYHCLLLSFLHFLCQPFCVDP